MNCSDCYFYRNQECIEYHQVNGSNPPGYGSCFYWNDRNNPVGSYPPYPKNKKR